MRPLAGCVAASDSADSWAMLIGASAPIALAVMSFCIRMAGSLLERDGAEGEAAVVDGTAELGLSDTDARIEIDMDGAG